MAKSEDFLVEVGCEELPPTELKRLSMAFANNLQLIMQNERLLFGDVNSYATPRRLAVLVKGLATKQPDMDLEKRGPAWDKAFNKNGAPSKACEGFARSCGVEVEKLEKLTTAKGEWVMFRQHQTGAKTQDLLGWMVRKALTELPVSRLMRWGDGEMKFVRPAHWVVMLFGKKVIKEEVLGMMASNVSYGHRFHMPKAIVLKKPVDYVPALLQKGQVMVDFEERRAKIREQIDLLTPKGGMPIVTEALLNEVTGMVEYPVVLLGRFPEQYLTLPSEVLSLSLQKHQRCFPIKNRQDKLQPYFIVVSNIKSKNTEQVIAGNRRVICARLADAEFFYNTDLKIKLAEYAAGLKQVVFQQKLGSLLDKSKRVQSLAAYIAGEINTDGEVVKRAAQLAKADLMTLMIGEFPELQGVMGYYYALFAAEPREVAVAIKEQYLPRFAGDNVPGSAAGNALALAERLDTLIGIFGINKIPTGAKDPFSLRRAALGVLRILIENKLDLELRDLLQRSMRGYQGILDNKRTVGLVLEFMLDRLRAYYIEQGISVEIFLAVMANTPTKPLDFQQRINAVNAFIKLPEATSLIAANKRVSNILKQAKFNGNNMQLMKGLLQESSEQQLAEAITRYEEQLAPLFDAGKYSEALQVLAALKPVVDEFFDQVMVMVDDSKLRDNRLLLLSKLRALFLHVADVSLLQ